MVYSSKPGLVTKKFPDADELYLGNLFIVQAPILGLQKAKGLSHLMAGVLQIKELSVGL